MNNLILAFISVCNKAGVTPAEKEIDIFIDNTREIQGSVPRGFRNSLIKFCFYHWEKRNDEEFLTQILEMG